MRFNDLLNGAEANRKDLQLDYVKVHKFSILFGVMSGSIGTIICTSILIFIMETLFAHWMFFTYLSIYGGITFKDTLFGKLFITVFLNIWFSYML